MLLVDLVFNLTISPTLDEFTTLDYLPQRSAMKFFVQSVLLAPLIEEMVFRTALRAPIYSLYVGPVLIIFLSRATWRFNLGFIVVIIILAFGAYIYIKQNKRKRGMQTNFFIARQYLQHYPKIFWLYTTAFALIHIINYGINDASGFLVIFAVIPQFVAGALWGYIRLRDGLMSCMASHALANFVPFVSLYGFGIDI